MKKIFLPLLLFPLAAWAQNVVKPLSQVSVAKSFPYVMENFSNWPAENVQSGTPVLVNNNGKTSLPGTAYKPSSVTIIGNTTYELQTNAALAKRVQLYSGGKISAVWTKSDGTDPNYPQRWTGYNSYDGSSWCGQNAFADAFEYDRSGWPNIGEVTVGSSSYEVLTSHYAAAGGTNYAGGIYWYRNSEISKPDFKGKQIIDLSNDRGLTQGLLWPRMATSGDKVFLIGTYQSWGNKVANGVKNPIVYFRYNLTTNQFTQQNVALPGYDSTRYVWGSADDYSIDARGPYVAILTGGQSNDLALWKSSDSGLTFTKTVIVAFAHAPYDYKIDPTFTDTTESNDGSGTVSLGSDGVAHVVYSDCPVINSNDNGQDSGVSYFGSSKGIIYWNDKDQQKITVGSPIDYDHNGQIDLTGVNLNSASAGYAGHEFASYPNVAIDAQNHVFVVFSCPAETDLDINGWAYRHIYVSAFDGSQWHAPQDMIQTWGNAENMFPNVARDVDNAIHFSFLQKNSYAGLYVPNSSGSQTLGYDTVKIASVSTSDILTDKVGTINLGVNNSTVNNQFTLGSMFPNPATNLLNFGLNLKSSAGVSLKLFSIVGQEVATRNYGTLPAGGNNIRLDVSNLPSGVYMMNVTAGGYTTSERIVIEK